MLVKALFSDRGKLPLDAVICKEIGLFALAVTIDPLIISPWFIYTFVNDAGFVFIVWKKLRGVPLRSTLTLTSTY